MFSSSVLEVILMTAVLLIPFAAIATPIIIVMIIMHAASGASQRKHVRDAQETRTIQEINRALAAMERRIENLELIMIEGKRATEEAESTTSVRDGGI